MTAPQHWLIKSEPTVYSFADLQRDGGTVWDGVRNNQAALYLKAMKVGDECFFYHSQKDLAVVGIAKVSKEAFLDPSDPAGRFVAVEVAPVKPLKQPVTLAQMKAEPKLADMVMFRLFRLSVTPITDDQWKIILGISDT
ncbi:putative RNA-binding protein with PUA-like domain [Caulobacter ginsengisoli]|uniref:RNA-binding protein with PUA-like domain n=1 Tax=Caulobacter ginsengisoli TaxID=400775 RepID=A0ABU0IUG1_9CAUL|nr:EVE domain-containing protein [Caulobacter ginsengisoli]MDQ0464986.1 putative RNA-binding protein with PUA-like domain [Caulobacter ginsengisoli]